MPAGARITRRDILITDVNSSSSSRGHTSKLFVFAAVSTCRDAWAPAGYFPGVGKLEVSGRKSPSVVGSVGPRWPWWGFGGEAPRSIGVDLTGILGGRI